MIKLDKYEQNLIWACKNLQPSDKQGIIDHIKTQYYVSDCDVDFAMFTHLYDLYQKIKPEHNDETKNLLYMRMHDPEFDVVGKLISLIRISQVREGDVFLYSYDQVPPMSNELWEN